MRGWTDGRGRRQEGGRAPGTRRRRRWTATTTGFEIGHERAFISSPAFQPTYARPRPEQPKPISSPVRTRDDSYKMNRRGRNRTRKVSHNWPFLLEQGAHVGALQAPSTSSFSGFLLLLLSFSVRRANQSISFESSSSVLFPPPPPSPPFPPPPSGEKERLGPSDRRRSCISRRWQQHSLPIWCEIVQHFKWDVYDTSAKYLNVKMALAMHMIHTRICPFIEDSTQGRR